MIAEIIPEAYDANGTQVSQPFLRRKGPHPTFPMGRYVSQPLTSNVTRLRMFASFSAAAAVSRIRSFLARKITGNHRKNSKDAKQVIARTSPCGHGVNYSRWALTPESSSERMGVTGLDMPG